MPDIKNVAVDMFMDLWRKHFPEATPEELDKVRTDCNRVCDTADAHLNRDDTD